MTDEISEDFLAWNKHIELKADEKALDRRRKAVSTFANQLGAKDVDGLARLIFRSKPEPGDSARERVNASLRAADTDYEAGDNEQEVWLLAAAAASELCRGDSDVSAVLALSIVSSSFQGAREPKLPRDLVGAARHAISAIGQRRRQRPMLSKLRAPSFPKAEFDKFAAAVKAQQDIPTALANFPVAVDAFKNATSNVWNRTQEIAADIDRFLAIQDEELQMLWWALGRRSWDFEKPFEELAQAASPLIFAKELAAQTTILPGPTAVPSLLAYAGLNNTPFSVAKCINSAPVEWLRSIEPAAASALTTPLHLALKRKLETNEDIAWVAGWSAATGLPADRTWSEIDLAMQFYRERLLIAVAK